MKLKIKFKLKGFTLLELLVVIGIIGILSSITIISFSSSRNIAKLEAAQFELISNIKLAQSYALQGKVYSGTTPAYYGVKFFNGSQYGICACSGNDCSTCNSGNAMEKYALQAGVTSSPASSYITFKVPHGTVKSSQGVGLGLTLSISGSSQTRSVTVNANGFIEQ